MKILVAEDEIVTRKLLIKLLRGKGHEVKAAINGVETLEFFASFQPELVLLDVHMPELDGWQVLDKIRSQSTVPVLMLTGLDSTEDVVKGLEQGADDYLKKPVELSELEARINSVFRRVNNKIEPSKVVAGPISIDVAAHEAHCLDKPLGLTKKEFALLLLLARNLGKATRHGEILDTVWGPDTKADSTDIKQYIHFLRKKIEAVAPGSIVLESVRGVGYRLNL